MVSFDSPELKFLAGIGSACLFVMGIHRFIQWLMDHSEIKGKNARLREGLSIFGLLCLAGAAGAIFFKLLALGSGMAFISLLAAQMAFKLGEAAPTRREIASYVFSVASALAALGWLGFIQLCRTLVEVLDLLSRGTGK